MSKKKKSDKSGIFGLVLLFFWLIFILFVVVFYFYYWDELPFNKKSTDQKTEEITTEGELQDNTSAYETVYKYQTNANPDINALITEYYSALASKDQAALKTMVTDSSVYDDMTDVLAKAAVITGYSNINCYTMDGMTEDATVVYVVSNITIKNVESRPLDISCFYVVKTDAGYLIDNVPYSDELAQFINDRNSEPDVQSLYQTVQDNINKCLEEDETFVTFYNRVNGDL